MGRQIDLGSGKVSIVIFWFAVPLMISLFFQNLYAYIDTVCFLAGGGGLGGRFPDSSADLSGAVAGKGGAFGSVVLISYARGAFCLIRVTTLGTIPVMEKFIAALRPVVAD